MRITLCRRLFFHTTASQMELGRLGLYRAASVLLGGLARVGGGILRGDAMRFEGGDRGGVAGVFDVRNEDLATV